MGLYSIYGPTWSQCCSYVDGLYTCTCISHPRAMCSIHPCASKKTSRFRSVPFHFSSRFNRSGPFHTVLFTSVLTVYRGQTVLALGVNSSAIHCVHWRSIARLFSTTTSRDGFLPTMKRPTGRALSRSSLLGYVRGLEETGALTLTCISTLHYRMYYIFR